MVKPRPLVNILPHQGRRHWRFEDSQTIFGPNGLDGWMVSIYDAILEKKTCPLVHR